MSERGDDPATRPDDENPEWTREELRHARPALEVIADVFGSKAAAQARPGTASKAGPENQSDTPAGPGRTGGLPPSGKRLADAHQRGVARAHAEAGKIAPPSMNRAPRPARPATIIPTVTISADR